MDYFPPENCYRLTGIRRVPFPIPKENDSAKAN